MVTNWEQLFKLRIANPDKSFQKHEICKLLILMKILNKHKHNKTWIRIYTEFVIKDGRKADLVYMNIKTKESYIYEIQKNLSKNWINQVNDFYKDFVIEGMNTTDLITIPIKNLSNDLKELSEELEEFIY